MNDYLVHYGVKGMRWGIRHDPIRTSQNSRRGLTAKQKKTIKRIAIGAAVCAGVVLASYGAYKLVEAKQAHNAYKIGKRLVTQKYRKLNIRSAKADESKQYWKALGRDPNSQERYKAIKKQFDAYMSQDAYKIEKEARDLGRKYVEAKRYNRKEYLRSRINPYSNLFGGPILKDDPIANFDLRQYYR